MLKLNLAGEAGAWVAGNGWLAFCTGS